MSENEIKFASEAPHPCQVDINGVPLTVHPEWQVSSHEHLLDNPIRVQKHASVSCMESFLEYVERFKLSNKTVVMLARSGLQDDYPLAKAVIDYHEPNEGGAPVPGWCEHTVTLKPQLTSAWRTWVNQDTNVMSQTRFAEFIYQNRQEVIEPNGADLLEVIQTLKATAKGEFQNITDIHSGSVQVVYRMKVSAAGGTEDKPVELPKQFSIAVRPFSGMETIVLTADLILKAPRSDGERVSLCYRIYRLDDVVETLCDSLKEQLATKLGVPVYRCNTL